MRSLGFNRFSNTPRVEDMMPLPISTTSESEEFIFFKKVRGFKLSHA